MKLINHTTGHNAAVNAAHSPTRIGPIAWLLLTAVIVISSLSSASASATPQTHYQVTLLRAQPGELPKLLQEAKNTRKNSTNGLLIMRHSQGDHWDLMLLQPTPSGLPVVRDYSAWAHYQLDFLAASTEPWSKLQQRAGSSGLFHIEMFHAAAGKKAALLEQRKMENRYYHATQRDGNAIFATVFGSDVDYFTIGFYRDLGHFASNPELPEEQLEQAAKQAGFLNRDHIGLYLRELIISHQDTLATKLR